LCFLLTMSRCLSIHGSSTKIALMLVRQASLSRTRRSRNHHIELIEITEVNLTLQPKSWSIKYMCSLTYMKFNVHFSVQCQSLTHTLTYLNSPQDPTFLLEHHTRKIYMCNVSLNTLTNLNVEVSCIYQPNIIDHD